MVDEKGAFLLLMILWRHEIRFGLTQSRELGL